MPVTESLMAVGSWSLTLSPDTPRSIIDALQYFQHIAVSTGRTDPRVAGNSLFASCRYAGAITGLDFQSLKQGRGPVISGDGMATWLGTPKGVGPVIENATIFSSGALAAVINTLRPSSVGAGTTYSIPGAGTYTGTFVWKTPRDALTSFAQQVTTGPLPTQIAEWRVNNTCTLDFGPIASLYRTTPACAIVSKDSGVDMSVRGLDGVAELIEDVKDYTTRVVVLASGSGAATAVGTANLADVGASNPYTDFFGNAVKMTRMVSASSVSSFNATASAQSALIPYTTPADQVRLSSSEYDIKGDLQVGDYVWLYDPDAGFTDPANEIVFRGQRINPTKQRVIEATWPVVEGMSVAYRDQSGVWHDLTDYVVWESGDTSLTVGGYNRNLVPTSEPVGPRPIPDTTVPGVPAFITPFTTTTYTGTSDGKTKAQIALSWSTPTNTDGTTMTDLDHYEIQYRPDLGIFAVNPTYNQLQTAGYTYNTLPAASGTYNQLLPQSQTTWKVTFVAGGTNQLLVQELTPGVEYDFQIRAVDTAQPPNKGAWSATTTFQAAVDTIPPPTPDAPTVAANMASVQISWDCGTSDGGTFNQAADLHHIEVHGSYDPVFSPSNATKLGNLPANIGNITGQIPVVGSFTIPPGQPPAQAMYIKVIAVDVTGNKSNPSAAAGATAVLWSNAYITDLSVSKVTAGTITATWINAGTIATASSGQRCSMDLNGFHAYDGGGNLVFDVNDSTSILTLGRNGASTASITLDTSTKYPTIYLNPGTGSNNASIQARPFSNNVDVGFILRSGTFSVNGFTSWNQVYADDTIAVMETATTGALTPNGGVNNGGFAFVDGTQGDFGVDQGSTGNQGWHIWNVDLLDMMGRWDVQNNYSGYSALYCGHASVGAGFSSGNVSYGATMSGYMMPFTQVWDNGNNGTYTGISAASATGYTFNYNNAHAISFFVWAVRT